jgi:hypothetical protein
MTISVSQPKALPIRRGHIVNHELLIGDVMLIVRGHINGEVSKYER